MGSTPLATEPHNHIQITQRVHPTGFFLPHYVRGRVINLDRQLLSSSAQRMYHRSMQRFLRLFVPLCAPLSVFPQKKKTNHCKILKVTHFFVDSQNIPNSFLVTKKQRQKTLVLWSHHHFFVGFFACLRFIEGIQHQA